MIKAPEVLSRTLSSNSGHKLVLSISPLEKALGSDIGCFGTEMGKLLLPALHSRPFCLQIWLGNSSLKNTIMGVRKSGFASTLLSLEASISFFLILVLAM